MITHTTSRNKSNMQIKNKTFKTSIVLIKESQHTFWSCLIRCVNMKWIEYCWRYRADTIWSTDRQTGRRADGQTDRQRRWNQYTPIQWAWLWLIRDQFKGNLVCFHYHQMGIMRLKWCPSFLIQWHLNENATVLHEKKLIWKLHLQNGGNFALTLIY